MDPFGTTTDEVTPDGATAVDPTFFNTDINYGSDKYDDVQYVSVVCDTDEGCLTLDLAPTQEWTILSYSLWDQVGTPNAFCGTQNLGNWNLTMNSTSSSPLGSINNAIAGSGSLVGHVHCVGDLYVYGHEGYVTGGSFQYVLYDTRVDNVWGPSFQQWLFMACVFLFLLAMVSYRYIFGGFKYLLRHGNDRDI